MLVLGHRGFHQSVPENTIQAFEEAVDLGVDGIETDVRLCSDGKLVLFHDRATKDGRDVSSLTLDELSHAAGYSVPTLEEALRSFPGVLWNLEIKAPAALTPTLDLLEDYRDSRRLLITSFWHPLIDVVSRVHRFPCGIILCHRPVSLGALLHGLTPNRWFRSIVWDYDMIDKMLLTQAREQGLDNYVYGMSTPAEHQEAVRLGVAGAITDSPELLTAALV